MSNSSIDRQHSPLLLKQTPTGPESSTNIASKCFKILQQYFFVIGILCSVATAASYPHIGCDSCILKPKITSSWIAVILIFFLRGISLKTTAFKKATLFWELNIFTHAFIFIYIPFVVYLLTLFLREYTSISDELIEGLLILSALPTTTVTCVVLTATSEGNEAAAIVNATVTNLTGILLSPTAVLILLGNSTDIDILDTFFKLAMKIMVPFCIGQIFRMFVGDRGREWILSKKAYFKKCIEIGLFYIVFCAISESFKSGFDSPFIDVFYMLLIIIGLHWILLIMNWYLTLMYSKIVTVCNINGHAICCCKPFDIYDRIAILFCATQKTAAMGLPMIETMFGNDSNMGIYIIPLLLMHPFQLIFDSLLVTPISKWREKQEQMNKLLDDDINDLDFDGDGRSLPLVSTK